MVKTMTQDTKDKIRDLERQKIDLEDRLEYVGNNLVKMHQIEQEIYEIEDTIAKLTAQIGRFWVVDAITIHVIIKNNKRS